METVEGLSTVSCLQQERFATGYRAELGLQVTGLAGKDQRGHGREFFLDALKVGLIGPGWLVRRWFGSPCSRVPSHGSSVTFVVVASNRISACNVVDAAIGCLTSLLHQSTGLP